MSAGKVLQVDTPAGLYEKPCSRKVASFIGNMNFFRGTVRRNGAAMGAIETEGLGHISMPLDQLAHADGTEVQVALRPEKFTLSTDKPETAHAVAGKLDTAAYLGERSHYYITIDGRAEPVAVSSAHLGQVAHAAGTPLWLSWTPDAVVVLDAE